MCDFNLFICLTVFLINEDIMYYIIQCSHHSHIPTYMPAYCGQCVV